MFHYLSIITAAYGLLIAASLLYDWLRPSAIPRFLRSDRDSWALVTGAIDGIGFGFCQELAERGFHVILHGRNQQELDRRASELSKEFPRLQTRISLADASKPVVPFDALLETIKATLNFNAGFTAKITRTLLPILMNNEPSLILNIGSLAALGVPRVSVHSGTKGFLVSHSESLPTELVAQGRDVTVHAVYVGPVQSGGYTPDDASLFVPTPRSMAQATTSQAGSRSRPS